MSLFDAIGKMFLPVLGAGLLVMLIAGTLVHFIPIIAAILAVCVLMRVVGE